MICGVPVVAAISRHDTARATMIQSGRRHSEFTVVIAWLRRQQTLAVAEPNTIPTVRKRATTLDELQSLTRFRRQTADLYLGAGLWT